MLSPTQSATAKFFRRSHDAVIRVYDEAGNVIEDALPHRRFQRVASGFTRITLQFLLKRVSIFPLLSDSSPRPAGGLGRRKPVVKGGISPHRVLVTCGQRPNEPRVNMPPQKRRHLPDYEHAEYRSKRPHR